MKRLTFFAVLFFLAGCQEEASPPTAPVAKVVVTPPSADEQAVIANLQIHQRDLEELEAVYLATESRHVRAAVIALREQEFVRRARLASSARDRYDLRQARRSWDGPAAARALFEMPQ